MILPLINESNILELLKQNNKIKKLQDELLKLEALGQISANSILTKYQNIFNLDLAEEFEKMAP